MEYQPWMDYIKIEDMPNDDLKFIAETAGLKSAVALIFCTPRLTVSIPKNSFKSVKEEYIRDKYDGTKYSINKLAVQCDMTQRQVYKIIEKSIQKKLSSD